jgi:hypothetical protein
VTEVRPPDLCEADEHGSSDASPGSGCDSASRAANDSEPFQDTKIYAHGPIIAAVPKPYIVADPAAIATAEQARFYDRDYRPVLRQMVDHVVEMEGPIFFDVLVDRISRAHGFQRSADRIRGILKTALGLDRMTITKEGDREIVWPPGVSPLTLMPYRQRRDRARN